MSNTGVAINLFIVDLDQIKVLEKLNNCQDWFVQFNEKLNWNIINLRKLSNCAQFVDCFFSNLILQRI